MRNFRVLQSDFEVNKEVAYACGITVSEEQYEEYGDRDENVVVIDKFAIGDDCVDYCNNPRDAWPIILQMWDRLGNIVCDYEGENAMTYWDAVMTCSMSESRPLRAAMIAFLITKDEESKE